MILGIDLGTTYTVGAYIDDNGEPRIINNGEGNTVTPSVVLFGKENEIVVGDVAKENAVICPHDVISMVKNHMGKKMILKEDEQKYTPEMISSFILRKLIQDAANTLGKDITGVVVTVPAYFTDAQRKATEDAVIMTGVPLVGMINEPTAAALCYIKNNNVQNENIIVYDLGGGTFDVTVLHVENGNNIEVLATGGLSNVGGRFFDQYIVDYVVDYMNEKHQIDLEDDEYVDELQDIYLKAERAKIQLSSKCSVNIPLKIEAIKEQIEITRELFNSMLGKVYGRTESKMKEAIRLSGLSVESIDKVLMVGGSSRIPYIVDSVKSFTGKEPSKEIHPDEAVALGAALYAQLNGSGVKNTVFTDVCSHSIGVVVINDNGQEENEVIIPRNSKLPTKKEQRFRTIVEGQSMICLTVTEGEYRELTDVTVIGKFDILLPSGLPKNALVLLHVSLDEYQLIHIVVELPDVGFSQEYRMRRIANMDEETVKNMTGILRDYVVS